MWFVMYRSLGSRDVVGKRASTWRCFLLLCINQLWSECLALGKEEAFVAAQFTTTTFNRTIESMRLLPLFLLLTSCAPDLMATAFITESEFGTTPTFTRSYYLSYTAESTPVIFNNTPLVVSFHKHPTRSIDVRHLDGTTISSTPWDYALGCALVVGSKLYVFASESHLYSRRIVMSYTDDLLNWSAPVTVKTLTGDESVWNVSVTYDSRGEYVMAYEVLSTGSRWFSFRFAVSKDLMTWSDVGVRYSHQYSACPTIRVIDGTYYVLFLSEGPQSMFTSIARSRDLVNFEQSRAAFLEPISGEGVNSSDVDLMEYNGHTTITYLTGDQSTWGDLKTATYPGTTRNLFESLFQ